MGLDLEYIDGQTPIDEVVEAKRRSRQQIPTDRDRCTAGKKGLRIKTISTQRELNEFEQQNIEETMQWVYGRRFEANDIFTESFVRNLHHRMFGHMWAWAGDFRTTQKNIGVDWFQIPVELKNLCDDTRYWIEHKTYPPEEIAVRFKHRLVSIHCFPNGNGRHSRLMADIIIEKLFGQPPFSWGAGDLSKAGDSRSRYITAVKAADRGDYGPLLAFVRE